MTTIIANIQIEVATIKKAKIEIEVPDYVTNDDTVTAMIADYVEANSDEIPWVVDREVKEEEDDPELEVIDWEFKDPA